MLKRSQHKGFTLLEIMIVVVILGILATMVVQNLADRPDEARVTVVKADLQSIESALILYKAKVGRYPTTEQGLEALIKKPQDLPTGAQWSGPYFNKSLKDPWGREYMYLSPGEKNREYDLYSLGADGEIGGEGSNQDIGNWEN